MKSRLDLQQELVRILGSNQVYFQPPEDLKMKYPCFVYERSNANIQYAGDIKYVKNMRYELMYISKDPDTNDLIKEVLESFLYCSYTRHFVYDNLNHEVFDLYY